MRAHWLLIAALTTACACCKNGPGAPGGGGGTGTGTGGGGDLGKAEDCPGLAAHVEELYRAGAERTKMTPEEIADNRAMVLGTCTESPGTVVACARAATSIAQLEGCLPPLDDDGSEGLQFQYK